MTLEFLAALTVGYSFGMFLFAVWLLFSPEGVKHLPTANPTKLLIAILFYPITYFYTWWFVHNERMSQHREDQW